MELEIITPLKVLYSAKITSAVIPSAAGEMGILPGHANFIVALTPGIVQLTNLAGENVKFTLPSGGTAKILSEKVIILAQESEAV